MIGVGNVGSWLGPALAGAGHTVTYGVRDPGAERHAEVLERTPGGATSTPRDAALAAEVVVLAVPWGVAVEVVRELGDLEGRIIADATNTLAPGFVLDPDAVPSGAHLLSDAATNARLVKAFNITGKENLADPLYPEGGAALPLCGDDEEARARVAELGASIGFDPVDCGDLGAARALEHMAWLWIRLAIPLGNGREVAWRLARR